MKKSNSETKTAGDNFTDKRFLTDKPLIKTETYLYKYSILLLYKKEQFWDKNSKWQFYW